MYLRDVNSCKYVLYETRVSTCVCEWFGLLWFIGRQAKSYELIPKFDSFVNV